VTLDRNSYRGFNDLGRAYILKEKIDAAIWSFEHAIRLNQEYCQAYSNLAAAFLRKGMFQRAIAASQNALALKPDYALAYLNLASAYLYLGDEKQAKTECRKAIKIDPNSPEPYNLLGLIMECAGKSKDAEAAYKQTVALAPHHFDANLNLGHFYLKSQSWDESIQHYCKVLEIKPDFPLAYINLAVVYYHKGKFQDAWDCVEKARILGMDPNPEFEQRLALAFKK